MHRQKSVRSARRQVKAVSEVAGKTILTIEAFDQKLLAVQKAGLRPTRRNRLLSVRADHGHCPAPLAQSAPDRQMGFGVMASK